MKRILTVVGVSLLSVVILPLVAQEGRPFNQIMKEVGGSVGEVKKAFEGQGTVVSIPSRPHSETERIRAS